MSRGSRENNLGVRVGDLIIHCNDTFVIVDIRRQEESDGLKLIVICTDAEQADKRQREQITQDQVFSKVTDLIQKLTEHGLGGAGGDPTGRG